MSLVYSLINYFPASASAFLFFLATNHYYSFDAFISWIHSLSIWQIVAIIALTLVDVCRNIGKPVVLLVHKVFGSSKRSPDGSTMSSRWRKALFPKISVLIPAHNESASIRRTIASALDNTYPNKEIIVIDDHSSDDTYQQALQFHEQGLIKLIRRTAGKGSKSGAINFGAIYASGDILMVMDGDTLIERNALSEVAKHISLQEVIAVAGNVRILSGDQGVQNLLTKCQAYEYLIAFELGRRVRLMLNILVIIPGAFGAFSKETAKKIGLYDKDTITEDFDLTIKLFKTGGRVEFIPNAIGWTFCPNNWNTWMVQRVRWSHGQFATLIKHLDIIISRSVAYKPLFVLAVFDMLFMDLILLFLRVGSIAWILISVSFSLQSIIFAITLVMVIYFVNELIAISTAVLLSPNKKDLRYAYLAPFVILIYRPIYSIIRFYAYMLWFFKKDIKW